PNNKNSNNNKYNNNQSINEGDIEKIDAPMTIKQKLIKNMDRLIDDQINVSEIEEIYNEYKDKLNKHKYSLFLGNVFDNVRGHIKDFKAVMMKSISNYIKQTETAENEISDSNEVIPDWFNDKKESSYKTDYSQYDFDKRGNPD